MGEPGKVVSSEIRVFCDASQESYGACAYLRCEFEDGTVECRLTAGKGRVAPLLRRPRENAKDQSPDYVFWNGTAMMVVSVAP